MFKKFKVLLLTLCIALPFAFAGCDDVAGRGTFSTPKNVTVEANGIVRFERVDDDEYYVININGNEVVVFANSTNKYTETYDKDGVSYLEYDVSRMLNLGESYAVKVKACGNNRKSSEFSEAYSYAHRIAMDAPKPKITGTVLTWPQIDNAAYYNIKVVRPTDKLDKDDIETIKKADLATYQYVVNRFDFSSILSDAGEYKFYVNAVSRDTYYIESDYSHKVCYNNILQLEAPVNSRVYNVDGDVHVVTVMDPKANAVKVKVNDWEIVTDIKDSNISIESTNLFDINLSKMFASTAVNFNNIGQFVINVQGLFETQSTKYYLDSEISENLVYNCTKQLSTPTVSYATIEEGTKYIAKWETEYEEYVSSFAVFVATPSGVERTVLSKEYKSMILPNDFISVFVQAIGQGNYASSKLSEHVSQYNNAIEGDFTASIVDNNDNSKMVMEMQSGSCNYYIVEVGNEFFIVENELELAKINSVVETVAITAIKNECVPLRKTMELDYEAVPYYRLKTPSCDSGKGYGFVHRNPYLLTFGAVENAIGYKIYLTQQDKESSAVAIPKLFTTTEVDLTPYIIKGGKYYVQIQAVADKYCNLTSSNKTTFKDLSITYDLVLDKPKFLVDADEEAAPVVRTVDGKRTKYSFNFYGVDSARGYEILVNYSTIYVPYDSKIGTGLYTVDITNYLSAASAYTIMVRAIPDPSDENRAASAYSTFEYILTMQLNEVDGIKVTATGDNGYTLSFNLQPNANSYRIRIVKQNDSNYAAYLAGKKDKNGQVLKNPFEVTGSCDISNYVDQDGEYYIYVTALAGKGSYYVDSKESSEYGVVSKLKSLQTPTNVQYQNNSASEFKVRWQGDEHADYYAMRVTNPKGKIFEYSVHGATEHNINDAITIEGSYIVTIKSMIKANSENASTYISSTSSDEYRIDFNYKNVWDFERYSVFYYGDNYNFIIPEYYEPMYATTTPQDNINQLANLLWYHMLYGTNGDNGLKLYVAHKSGTTVLDAIKDLATASTACGLYDFYVDNDWNTLEDTDTAETYLGYICEKILGLYPEMGVVSGFTIKQDTVNKEIFKIEYTNVLDVKKEGKNLISLPNDYSNDFKYLSQYLRRGENSIFAIDSYPEMEVTTTEQLLMAVQYGRKPVFVGNSTDAETVYNNAKKVLIAIASQNMTDYEKSTAIFDWISYAYNFNDAARNKIGSDGFIQQASLAEYGKKKEFYLEGIFLDLNNINSENFDGEFYLGERNATSESFAKAYTLLCGIEGIKTRKVNGTISYGTPANKVLHSWNKVYLSPLNNGQFNWYNVDITNSDMKYGLRNQSGSYIFDVDNSYAYSSHMFYLVTDAFLSGELDYGPTTSSPLAATINQTSNSILNENMSATTSFNYYANTTFKLTTQDIRNTINDNNSSSNQDLKGNILDLLITNPTTVLTQINACTTKAEVQEVFNRLKTKEDLVKLISDSTIPNRVALIAEVEDSNLISKAELNKILSNNESVDAIKTAIAALDCMAADEVTAFKTQITNKITNFTPANIEYLQMYDDSKSYQYYGANSGNRYSPLQKYLINVVMYAKHKLLTNKEQTASFEFKAAGDYDNTIVSIINEFNSTYKQTTAGGDHVDEENLAIKVKSVYDGINTTYVFVLSFV